MTDVFKVKVSKRCRRLAPGCVAASLFGSLPLGWLETPLIALIMGGKLTPQATFFSTNNPTANESSHGYPQHQLELFSSRRGLSNAMKIGLPNLRNITLFNFAEARSCGELLIFADRNIDGTISGHGNILGGDPHAPTSEPRAAAILDEVCFRSGEDMPFTTSTWAGLVEVPLAAVTTGPHVSDG